MKLYDMAPKRSPMGSPKEIDSGETFRSEQVYRCSTCHSLTNEWEDRGRYGAHLLCPVDRTRSKSRMVNNKPYFERVLEVREAQQKHQELLEAMGKKTELEQDADVYDIGDDNIPSNIKEELESIEAVITNLRDWFDGRYDDIVGIEVEDDWEIEGEFHSG